jgi:hypothetical protein
MILHRQKLLPTGGEISMPRYPVTSLTPSDNDIPVAIMLQ